MKNAWVLILGLAGVALVVFYLLKKNAVATAATRVPVAPSPSNPAGGVAGAFTNLLNAGATAAGDWIASKLPATNAPIQPTPVGAAPKLSTPSNTSAVVYSA